MKKEERIERAEKMEEELAEVVSVDVRVWTPSEDAEIIRIYVGKRGYITVDADGGMDVDAVKGAQFSEAKAAAEKLGYRAYR